MAQNVRVIPATINRATQTPIAAMAKRKVAGYARVSTDQEEQQTSYEAQVDYYTNFIKGREDWEFVSVYTDEGISATSTKHREGFQQMVEDALAGRIDLIVTKSVSRFARKKSQISNLREIYADVMDYGDLEQEKEKLKGERDAVGEKYRQEIEKNARVAQNQDEYKKREAELAEEYNRVDAEAKAVEAEIQKRQSCGRRIETLVAALETAGEDFTVSLWGSMVEKVTVFEDGLVFMLTSGEEVKVAPC